MNIELLVVSFIALVAVGVGIVDLWQGGRHGNR